MKIKTLLILAGILVLNSCVSTYYQMYKAVPTEDLTIKDDALIFENDDCRVSYNLWSSGGNIGFVMYNKSNENIHVILDESFFILNGFANNYFQNRVFTKSNTLSISTSTIIDKSSLGTSVSYNEEKDICIPPHASKIISEYSITKELYRDCDLLKYPTTNQAKSLKFTKDNSPFVFSNFITYTMGQANIIEIIKNDFYVNEITNYPENMVLDKKLEKFCGQEGTIMIDYFKMVSPDKFYFKYINDGFGTLKH